MPSSTFSQLTQSGDNPTFFRTITPDEVYALGTVEQAEKLGATKVALLKAVQKAGSADTEKVREVLRSEYVDTRLGKIR